MNEYVIYDICENIFIETSKSWTSCTIVTNFPEDIRLKHDSEQ